jgi:hypothetical protein
MMHLSADELAVWNQLDKAVGRLLKDRKRNDPVIGNFDARTAAKLRDRISNPAWSHHRAAYIAEAQAALESDEWWHSSVHGSGGDDV